MANWAALHIKLGDEETFVNTEAVMRIQQLAERTTKIIFADGREIVVRENASEVLALFHRD